MNECVAPVRETWNVFLPTSLRHTKKMNNVHSNNDTIDHIIFCPIDSLDCIRIVLVKKKKTKMFSANFRRVAVSMKHCDFSTVAKTTKKVKPKEICKRREPQVYVFNPIPPPPVKAGPMPTSTTTDGVVYEVNTPGRVLNYMEFRGQDVSLIIIIIIIFLVMVID